MKSLNYLKKSLIILFIGVAAVFLGSCDNNPQPEDTKVVAEEQNDEKFDNNKDEKDAQFLVNASEINLEQVNLGKLAQQNGDSVKVKELGKMMEDAHTKSFNDLDALAKSKMITIPTSSTDNAKKAYAELNEKSGKEFDKEYVDMMVSKHKDAIKTFENAATESNDPDIKNWATVSLPELRKHQSSSIDLQKNLTALNSQHN